MKTVSEYRAIHAIELQKSKNYFANVKPSDWYVSAPQHTHNFHTEIPKHIHHSQPDIPINTLVYISNADTSIIRY